MRKMSSTIGMIAVVVVSLACIPLVPVIGYLGAFAIVVIGAGMLWLIGELIIESPSWKL